ncbi:UNVERIFIED_CONTAM: Copia protein [Sesamum indicum]
MDKRNQYCTHCAKAGHAKETCFKLHRYPEWFKELAEKKKRYGTDTRTLNAVTSETAAGLQQEVLTQNLSAMMSELLQMMKGKIQSDPTQVHFARLGEFAAGTSFNFLSNTLGPNLWIIDSGATAHMCANLQLMSNLKPYIADSSVILPDGTKHNVTDCGSVALSRPFSECSPPRAELQTQLALNEIKKFSMKSKTEICLNAHSNDAVLWHRRLGHTPLLVLRHTNVISGSSYAILTATYIINRLPTSVLHWKSPYEVLYNKAVDYSIVRTFGCLAFVTNVLPHKSKFTKRAFRCVFVGYAFGQKGYKLYDLDDKVILISRDVIFHENCFPYKDISESEHAVPLPISVWDDGAFSDQSSPIAECSSTPVEPVLDSHHTSPHISMQQHEGTSSVPVLRRSLRQATKPSWLNDFVCGVSDASATPPKVTFITPLHHAIMQAITPLREPTTYLEANASPEWRSAMQA